MEHIKYKDFKEYQNYPAKQFCKSLNYSNFILELNNLLFEIDLDQDTNCFYIVNSMDSQFLNYDEELYNKDFRKMKTIVKEIEKRLKRVKKDTEKALEILKDK